MGMYTELIISCRLKQNTPIEVIETLQWMCLPLPRPEPKPASYPFGSGEDNRISIMFRCSSAYFPFTMEPKFTKDAFDQYTLITRSNIKNYSNEIERFLDWLKPYIESGSGIRNFYAIVCYEEQAEPTIYYLDEKESSYP